MRFKHLEKVVKVVEQPATQHIGEVIVQHLGVVAKLVRYLARCARGIQRVGDNPSTSGEIHALLRREKGCRNVASMVPKSTSSRIFFPIGSVCIIHDMHNGRSVLCGHCLDKRQPRPHH
jgi:hypothetical protein